MLPPYTVVCKRSFNPAKLQIAGIIICKRCDVTHLIHYLLPKIGRRLTPKVIYRIRVRIKASKEVPAITKAINVSYPTIYKI